MNNFVNLSVNISCSSSVEGLGVSNSRLVRASNACLEGYFSGLPPDPAQPWHGRSSSPVWASINQRTRGPTGALGGPALSRLDLVQPLPQGLRFLHEEQPTYQKLKPSTIRIPDSGFSASTIVVPKIQTVTWPPQRQKLARYASDLQTNWIESQPQIISFEPPPAIARFEPPPSYYKRVARPTTEILRLVDCARLDPENALAYQEEAWRKSEEAIGRFRSGVESSHLERSLMSNLRPSAISQMLEIAPDALQAGVLFYRVLTNSGFPTDSARRICLPGQMLDRSISATADLQGWLPTLETALGVLGGVADYSSRLKAAQVYTDDGLRAWSIATDDFIAERGTALALGVLASYVLAAIPGVGPFLGFGLSLFSGALAKRLTRRLPLVD